MTCSALPAAKARCMPEPSVACAALLHCSQGDRLAVQQGRHNSSELLGQLPALAPCEGSGSSIPPRSAGSLHQPRLAVSNDALEGWHVAGLSARSASSPQEMHGLLASAYVARDRSYADLGAVDEHSAVALKIRLAQFVPATEDQDEDSAVVRGAGDSASSAFVGDFELWSGWWQSVQPQCKSRCGLACHARLSPKHGTFKSGKGQVSHKVPCSVIVTNDAVGNLKQTMEPHRIEAAAHEKKHGLEQ